MKVLLLFCLFLSSLAIFGCGTKAAWREQVVLGGAAVEKGDFEAARAHFRLAWDQRPWDATAPYNIGQTYLVEGEYGEAQSFFERALEIDPRHELSSLNLAVIASGAGDFDAAEAHLQRVLEQNPVNLAARVNLANIRFRQGRLLEALRVYQQITKEGLATAPIEFNHALVLEELGQADAAIEAYRRALKIDQDFQAAHKSLAALYAKGGQQRLAHRHVQIACRLQGTAGKDCALGWDNERRKANN